MPLGESMQSVVRSNKSIMIDKSRRFRKTLGGYDSEREFGANLPKANPKTIAFIRKQMRKENKQRLTKVAIIFCVITLIIVFLILIYVKQKAT